MQRCDPDVRLLHDIQISFVKIVSNGETVKIGSNEVILCLLGGSQCPDLERCNCIAFGGS